MSLGRRILQGFSLLALRLAGMVMLAAGAGSLAVWSSLVAVGVSSEAWVNSVRIFTSRLGITFLLAGSAALILLHFSSWFHFEQRGSSDAGAEEEIGGWLSFLALSLVVLPLAALAVASPLVSLWREPLQVMDTLGVWNDVRKALGDQLGGLLLGPLLAAALPALLEFAPLVSSLASSAVLLVLLSLRTRAFPKVFLVCIVIQLAFVLGSFYTIDLLANVTPALLNELRGDASQEAAAFAAWIRRHDEIVGPTAINVAWLFLGYLVWVPALVVSRRAKRTFTVEASARSLPSLESIHARLAEASSFQAAPSVAPGSDVGVKRPQPETSTSYAAHAAGVAGGLQYSTFLIRPLLSLKSVFADPDYEISAPANGSGQKVVFHCRVTPGMFNLGFPLRVLTAADERELVLITRRRISLTSVAYNVSVPSTQETLGVFVRTNFGGTLWVLGDSHGRQIGWVARVAVGLGLGQYQARIEEVPVCQFVWRDKLWREKFFGRGQVEIAFAQEGDRTLDKRLGLAFGVLLERHLWSRTFY